MEASSQTSIQTAKASRSTHPDYSLHSITELQEYPRISLKINCHMTTKTCEENLILVNEYPQFRKELKLDGPCALFLNSISN